MKETLCWECANSCGGCSWSQEFKPVEGWEAEPTIVEDTQCEYESFNVKSCPQFKPDRKRVVTYEDISTMLGKSIRTLFRWKVKRIKDEAKKKGHNLKYSWADKIWYEIRG